MRTRYGVSPWIDTFPSTRRPDYPRLRGEHTADVVIVGGGLTGCATAYACARRACVPSCIEADRIGWGSAGRSAGLLLSDPGVAFRDIAKAHGLRAARRVFEGYRKAALDAAATLRRLNIRCDLAELRRCARGDPRWREGPATRARRARRGRARREVDRGSVGAERPWRSTRWSDQAGAGLHAGSVPRVPRPGSGRAVARRDPLRAITGQEGSCGPEAGGRDRGWRSDPRRQGDRDDGDRDAPSSSRSAATSRRARRISC